MSKIKLSSIVAMAQNYVIGKDNKLLWHIPEDFKHFKRTTMGRPLIMGRKTFESLPAGPLPGRPHVIISRSGAPAQTSTLPAKTEGSQAAAPSPELHYVKSLAEGIAAGKGIAQRLGVDEAFIVGGGEIYSQTIDLIDRLYLTLIHQDFEGDTNFPAFDWDKWEIIFHEKHKNKNLSFSFYTLNRT